MRPAFPKLLSLSALVLLASACTAQRAVAPSPLEQDPPAAAPETVAASGADGMGEVQPASTEVPAPVGPPPDAKVRLRAVGDVMLGSDFPKPEDGLPPEDGATILAQVKDAMADADLTFINLEGPLCDSGTTNKCGKGRNCYAFRTPTSYVKWLTEAGVDLASTANNHSGDFGEECRRETEKTLDAVGIRWSGAPGTIASTESNGLKIGMVAFHTSASCNHLNDHEAAAALVKQAAEAHDLVVVSFHGGAEGAKHQHVPNAQETFFGENRGHLRVVTRLLIDAGADLVIGHGPHVVRGIEFYKGKLIAYSLGNFATYGSFNLRGPNGLGAILEVTLDAQGAFVGGKLLPTLQAGRGIPAPDPKGAAIERFRALTAEDFPQTGAVIAEDGTISMPTEGAPQS